MQVTKLAKKLRYLLFTIKYLKPILNKSQLFGIYHALFESTLQYGILAWGGAYDNTIRQIYRIQNRAVKMIFNKHKFYPTDKLYRDCEILNTKLLYSKTIILYQVRHNKFIYNSNPKNTRAAGNAVVVPKMHTTIGQRCFVYLSAKLYNLIPDSIKSQIPNYKHFKSRLTLWLLREGYHNET